MTKYIYCAHKDTTKHCSNFRKQYGKMLKRARQYGYESTVMRPVNGGSHRQMIQAIVVPAEEIENNPDFAEIREREGLGEGTSGVSISWCMLWAKFLLLLVLLDEGFQFS